MLLALHRCPQPCLLPCQPACLPACSPAPLQCSIDLKDNVLRFGSTGAALRFLPEHEIPSQQRHGSSPAKPGSAVAVPSPAAAPAPAAAAPPAAAAAPPAAAAGGSGGGGGGQVPPVWEAKLQKLQELGFSREQCLQALRSTNGNEDMAGSLLFGGF
jgi:DNA damage-inducible protein 1